MKKRDFFFVSLALPSLTQYSADYTPRTWYVRQLALFTTLTDALPVFNLLCAQSLHNVIVFVAHLLKVSRFFIPSICILCLRKTPHRCGAGGDISRSGLGFHPRSGQVSWVRFFRGFSSPVRQMSGSFRPHGSPHIIWPP